MKRIFYLLMTFSILMVLVACGNDSSTGEGSNEGENFSNYPEENITLIVPWGAGGDTDVIARTVNKYLEEELGTKVITQNIGGGGGVIGATEGLSADPDGYTIINGHDSIGISKLSGTSDFDYFDFEPVALMTTSSNIVVTNADNDWDNMSDVIEQAKNEPGSISFGATVGSTTHTIPLGIMEDQGVEFNIVNYEGTAERTQALLGNHVDLASTTVPAAKDYIESGDLKLLGLVSDERNGELPDLETLKEQGIDFSSGTNRGYFLPKDTPQEIVEILSEALGNVASNEEFQKEMKNLGVDVNYLAHEEYKEFLEEDLAETEEILRNQGVIE
ncbi:Tripartite tricarboxylate transporter family receptor [Jeotgalicoccus saudimassiliensis]|uniref:Tripartite tricarboxylate transporter family receptor n=1 Tax=Jeotgalicoccus saudimassiliensis TaxID=1461582 RepID=A0A078M9L4_9STAP|nr:tripartite tricarboxylate transporter substrate binding protein [Jeotgalicoccus saudimassiliensis]CEA03005.1 Tripartite tricarboxylate transporter family receptor [Jeotgalicoccus saudimassiliensis]